MARSVENNVLHGISAKRRRTRFAEHPSYGVNNVRFSASIGSDNADELTRAAIKAIDTAATKGVFHRNGAARRTARLMRDLNAVSAH